VLKTWKNIFLMETNTTPVDILWNLMDFSWISMVAGFAVN
jgi:hypothetical protein